MNQFLYLGQSLLIKVHSQVSAWQIDTTHGTENYSFRLKTSFYSVTDAASAGVAAGAVAAASAAAAI